MKETSDVRKVGIDPMTLVRENEALKKRNAELEDALAQREAGTPALVAAMQAEIQRLKNERP